MPPHDNDLSEKLFGGQEPPVITPLAAVKEAFLTVAPGLKDFGPQAKAQLEHLGNLGRSELANALFGNGAFVLYSHEPKNENSLQGQNGPEQTQGGQDRQHDVHGPRLERGGRSL
jgi:hypothetical protein